jgi:hypothetical protein
MEKAELRVHGKRAKRESVGFYSVGLLASFAPAGYQAWMIQRIVMTKRSKVQATWHGQQKEQVA